MDVKDYRDVILELLISTDRAWATVEIGEKLNQDKEQVNISIESIINHTVNNHQIIEHNVFGRDNYTIRHTKYAKIFINDGGFTQSEINRKQEVIRKKEIEEQEQNIRDKQESNLESNTKFTDYQYRFRHLDTTNRILNLIIGTKAILIGIVGFALYGLATLVIWLWKYLIQHL